MNPTPRPANRMDKAGQSYLGHLGTEAYHEDAGSGHLERGQEEEEAGELPNNGESGFPSTSSS